MEDELVSLAELQARLDWTMTPDEERIATSALWDLTDDARGYGRDWDALTVPRQVKVAILRAAVRYLRNPDGYVQSRAGDETVVWSDTGRPGGNAEFTADEITLIKTLAGKSFGLMSVPTEAWGTRPRQRCEGYVPSDTPGLFPLFNSDTSPW